ncbi:peptidoglycan DD-metalloendopeptidase family protein [Virgibacillus ihumii]|uniref:peptidoglycan DD-metalloendopeptidase family protein n=1 Tax=Virgibacillus ihumii TaxID=2686091 RepID=UPI00157D3EDA|nr:peptidoglycan DD-metalloendopeptidase family protein [Virgibacillus ihumii]
MKQLWNAAKSIAKKKIMLWVLSFISANALTILIGIFLMTILLAIIGGVSGSVDHQKSAQASGTAQFICSPAGEINMKKWNSIFQNKKRSGALKGYGDEIVKLSKKRGIDPVLFAAIAMHETAWGESHAVKAYNNPGGLMNPNGSGLLQFDTMQEGLESMALTLHNRIIVDGLVTIEQLGSVYAPIGAANDPNNLNAHWVPTTKEIVKKFGGLTKNCKPATEVDMKIIGNKSWLSPHTKNITSGFGYRSCYGCSSFHGGLDVASAGIRGTPITAFADGKVIVSEASGTTFRSSESNLGSGYGWHMKIKHDNGMVTHYAHMKEKGVPVGTKVEAGDVIGRVGSTGSSTGAHLHFEIIINGEKVNPMQYIKPFLTGGAST